MSFQTLLTNHTPFSAGKYVLPTPDGQEATLYVLAATFEETKGNLLPVAEQAPIQLEDLHEGEPGVSSLLTEGELALFKPKVDILVVGTAYAPKGRPAARVPVGIKVADVQKALLVSGPRVWSMGTPISPVPFTQLPIRYERAFGGTRPDGKGAYALNPVGVGFEGAVSKDSIPLEVPSVEYADALILRKGDRPRPAGLTAIFRAWQPRLAFGGTYDDAWKENRWPLLPKDFDPRFNQTAPEDQQSATVAGGETVGLINLTPDGVWQFKLPTLDFPVHVLYDGAREVTRLRLDTVVIEPDFKRVRLTARMALTTRRGKRVREVVLGHKTRAWLRAFDRRKPYVNFRATDGADLSLPTFRP
jgi:hypothetical protein